MSEKLPQRQDGSRTLEDCKDLSSMLETVFLILMMWMAEPSGQEKDKKKKDSGE